jgi:hypothetical protein
MRQQSKPYLAGDGKDLVRETRAEITGGVYGNPCGASQAKNDQLNHQANVKCRQRFVQGNEFRVQKLHLHATSPPRGFASAQDLPGRTIPLIVPSGEIHRYDLFLCQRQTLHQGKICHLQLAAGAEVSRAV